jgi:hypothetical protein
MGRFWYLSDYSTVVNPIFANGATNGSNSLNGVKAYTVDLEAQRMFTNCSCGRCFLTFGTRYASLSSDSIFNSMALLGGTDFVTATASSSSRFNGVGLTSALYGYKPVCCSDFSLFYNVRNSIIFGNSESQAFTGTTAQNTLGNTGTTNAAIANAANTLYIGELQLGGQWNHQFRCLPLCGFFRVAGEYQYWGSANNAVAQAVSVSSFGPSGAQAAAYGGKTNVSFVGFAIATGCTW